MKYIIPVAIFCIVVFAAIPLWATETLTMKEAVEEGLKSNPQILAVREALFASDYAIKASQASFGPSMSTQYGYTRLDERRQSMGQSVGTLDNWALQFNVHQPLFTGFQLLTTYEKSVLQKEQVTSQLSNAELRLILAIQSAFLQLLQARDNVRSAQDSLVRLKAQAQVNAAFYEVGLRPKLDLLQAEVDVARAEQVLFAASNNVDTLGAELNTLLGRHVNSGTEYVGSLEFFPISLSLDECLRRAAQNRPDLEIARQTVMLAEKDVTLAKVAYYPQVGADFNYVREGDNPDVDGGGSHTPSHWNAQVGMSWTFFEWGKTFYGQKQAEKNVSRVLQEYQNLENTAFLEVKTNFLQIEESVKRIAAAKQGLVAAKESYRMAKARYEAQVGTNTDVLDAQSAQTVSEAALTAALANYERAAAGLFAAMGEKNLALLPQ